MFEKEAEEYAKDYEASKYIRTVDEIFKDGAEYGYNKANKWHYPSKGEYPEDVKINEFEIFNPLVLVFFYHEDSYGNKVNVFGLDRWRGSPFNEWKTYYKYNVIAWQYLPEPPKED